MASKSLLRRWLPVAGLCVLLVDVAINALLIRDGALGFRALPPFRGTHHPWQRRWLAEQQVELGGNSRPGAMGAFDAELGWTNSPSARAGLSAAVPYTYNRIGARSEREYEATPGPGKLRLACFGESFTQGDEVGDGDTWPALLEAGDGSLEVLNLGVGGYGTDQALLRMRREGLHGARIATLGFMTENIGRNVNRYRPLWHPRTAACVAKPRFLLSASGLELLPIPYQSRAELIAAVANDQVVVDLADHEFWIDDCHPRWLGGSALARLAWGYWAYRRREVPRLYADPDGEPFRTSLEILVAFEKEARNLGAERAWVLFFPRREDLALVERDNAYWRPFLGALRSRGVEVLDLTGPIAQAAAAHSPAEFWSGAHYARPGNQAVAAALSTWLQTLQR
jgi:hypothetical protein